MALTSKDIALKEEHPLIASAGIIGAMLAIGYTRAPAGQTFAWMDYAAFAVFGLLCFWCLSPRRDRADHDEPSDNVALRLGKLCKRALGRLKRRGVAS